MAITRTQIAKQLLEQGGRVGLQGGGADLGAGASGMGSGTTGNDNRERGMEESMRQAQTRADLGALANRGADDKLQEQLESASEQKSSVTRKTWESEMSLRDKVIALEDLPDEEKLKICVSCARNHLF